MMTKKFMMNVTENYAEFDGFDGDELVMITSDCGKVSFNTRQYVDNNDKKHRVVLNDGKCTDPDIVKILRGYHYDDRSVEFTDIGGTYLEL